MLEEVCKCADRTRHGQMAAGYESDKSREIPGGTNLDYEKSIYGAPG
jgi:hypothetical protein